MVVCENTKQTTPTGPLLTLPCAVAGLICRFLDLCRQEGTRDTEAQTRCQDVWDLFALQGGCESWGLGVALGV